MENTSEPKVKKEVEDTRGNDAQKNDANTSTQKEHVDVHAMAATGMGQKSPKHMKLVSSIFLIMLVIAIFSFGFFLGALFKEYQNEKIMSQLPEPIQVQLPSTDESEVSPDESVEATTDVEVELNDAE